MKKITRTLGIITLISILVFQIWLRTSPISEHTSNWQHQTALNTPRSEISAAVLDKHIYVAGGIGARGTLDSVEGFNHETNTWQTLAPLPQARHHVALATHGQAIYAFGGFSNIQFKASATTWRYHPRDNTWHDITPMPAPRGEHVAISNGDFVYILAGSGEHSQQVWRYAPALNQWQPVGDLMPTARDSVAAATKGQYIYVTGGRYGREGGSDMTVVERFNTADGTWETLAPMPTPKAGHAAAIANNTLYVFGGEDLAEAEVHGEVYAYDIANNTWRTAGYLPEARHGLAGVSLNNTIYAIGGGNRSGLRTPFALGEASYALPMLTQLKSK